MNHSVAEAPNVLISYSWSPDENATWVLELAKQLRADGVDVKIDVWDLQEGQDMIVFMESMALDPSIKHVLLICNKDYAFKANSRKGGVGRESSVISPEVYDKTDQTKYIPLILEHYDTEDGPDLKGKPCLPQYLKSRFSIDFSDQNKFEEKYDQLVRRIFDKPLNPKPPLGNAPSYLFEQSTQLRTTPHSKRLKNSFREDGKNKSGLLKDYLDQIFLTLQDLEINALGQEDEVDELILEKLMDLKFLRDEMIDIFQTCIRYSDFEINIFTGIFERILNMYFSRQGDMRYDHYKFFGIELFIYLSALLLKEERYNDLAHLLHRSYLISDSNTRDITTRPFTIFTHFRVQALDEIREQKIQSRRPSITADVLKERSDNEIINFDLIQQTEILIHYVSLILGFEPWLPYLVLFKRNDMTRLQMMKSKTYFEKIKVVFGVNNEEELIRRVAEVISRDVEKYYHSIRMSFPYIKDGLYLTELCSIA